MLTATCPMCRKPDIAVFNGRLAVHRHRVGPVEVPCAGAGMDVSEVREIQAAHSGVNAFAQRLRRRG